MSLEIKSSWFLVMFGMVTWSEDSDLSVSESACILSRESSIYLKTSPLIDCTIVCICVVVSGVCFFSDCFCVLNFDLLASQSNRFMVIWFEGVVVLGNSLDLIVGLKEYGNWFLVFFIIDCLVRKIGNLRSIWLFLVRLSLIRLRYSLSTVNVGMFAVGFTSLVLYTMFFIWSIREGVVGCTEASELLKIEVLLVIKALEVAGVAVDVIVIVVVIIKVEVVVVEVVVDVAVKVVDEVVVEVVDEVVDDVVVGVVVEVVVEVVDDVVI